MNVVAGASWPAAASTWLRRKPTLEAGGGQKAKLRGALLLGWEVIATLSSFIFHLNFRFQDADVSDSEEGLNAFVDRCEPFFSESKRSQNDGVYTSNVVSSN
jgi:hypothetical protein